MPADGRVGVVRSIGGVLVPRRRNELEHVQVNSFRAILAATLLVAVASPVLAAEGPVTVNVENYARAETDMQIGRMLKMAGGVNKLIHNREPTPLDKQLVIRMNRDTLYSFAIVDISKGATVTMPEAGERYMSLMVVNNDGYINKVYQGGGTYKLTMEEFDTPYVVLAVRTLVNASDDADVKAATAVQDKMKIEAASAKPFVMPNYDMDSYNATYKPLLELSKGLPDTHKTFGKKADVDPVRFLLGSAFGWGGLPVEREQHFRQAEQGRLLHRKFRRLRGQARQLLTSHRGLELRSALVSTARGDPQRRMDFSATAASEAVAESASDLEGWGNRTLLPALEEKLGENHAMSALGQKRTWERASRMSALPPKADIRPGALNVR